MVLQINENIHITLISQTQPDNKSWMCICGVKKGGILVD